MCFYLLNLQEVELWLLLLYASHMSRRSRHLRPSAQLTNVSHSANDQLKPNPFHLILRRKPYAEEITHVVPDSDGGWNVKKGGAERASKHFDRKRDAVDYGRNVSRNQESELVIHRKDEKIERSDSHGHAPNPPKDKK